MSFDLDNFVPSQQQDGQAIRTPPTSSLDDFVPSESVPQMLERNAQQAAVGTLQDIGKVANVIRYPFDRFIWYPIGTIGEQAGSALAGVKEPPPSGQEFLHQPLAPLTRIWNNYWKASSGRNTDAPDWYKQLAVGGTIMATEPGILAGAFKGAETLATRPATAEEAQTIRNAFQPLKDSLSKMGVESEDLHPEGNIVTLSNDSELYFNKHVSAVLRGDDIRIPRWMKINSQEVLPPPETLPLNHLDNLPATTKSIIPTPPSLSGPDLTSESGQVAVPPIAEFIKASTQTLPTTKDWEKGFTQLKTQSQADDLRAKQLLEKVTLSPADAEAIYHHQENPKEPLTDAQQKIYDENIKPLADKSAELFSKLRNDGIPIPTEGYTPRFIEGRGNMFDRIKSGVQNVGSGVSGLFKKTSGSFKTRVMKALTDEEGNRTVVSIKKGEVVSYRQGEKPQPLGKINSQEMEELLDKETAPLRKEISKLETEEKILMANKYRAEATRYSIADIQRKIMDLHSQVLEKNWQYNPDNLEMKVFVDKNGKRWTVGEATTREIEGNTDLTYHKNALLNNLVHYNELRKIDRATQYLENIKANPEFQKFSMKVGTGNPPADWKMTSLPQFRGYYLEPRIADTFDYFNKQLYKGRDPIAVFSNINRFLRTTIFFNPLIHIPNVTTHWLTERGVSGLSPTTWGRLAKTTGRAIEAVTKQNKDYLDMLDSGVNLMYHGVSGQTLADLMLDKMGQELRTNDKLFLSIKKVLGNFNPYNISSKVTWAYNDIATLQAIYEQEELGKTSQVAIDEVSKHIPNYVVPSRVLNSRFLSEVMTNPNLTMFGAYHYGALKSYGEIIKSLLGKVPLEERAEAADKLAMIGLLLFVLYPMADEILKKITGNPEAHIRRAGSTTLPANLIKLVQGKEDYSQALQSVLTPAIGLKAGMELYNNMDSFTGNKIINRDLEAEGLKNLAVESIAPLAAVTRITEGKVSFKDYLLSMAGVSMSDPNKTKLYMMKDSKAEFQKEFEQMYAKDPEQAIKTAQDFNTKQINDLKDVAKEEKLKDLPRSVVDQFIITSMGHETTKHTAGDMLQKNHPQKRRRFSILNEGNF